MKKLYTLYLLKRVWIHQQQWEGFIFHIFGAMAEMKREVISERVISGVTAAKARGRKISRKEAHTL